MTAPTGDPPTVSDRAASLWAARAAWEAATRDGAAACGLDVTGEAYEVMRAAWFDELGVHISILEAILERSDVDR